MRLHGKPVTAVPVDRFLRDRPAGQLNVGPKGDSVMSDSVALVGVDIRRVVGVVIAGVVHALAGVCKVFVAQAVIVEAVVTEVVVSERVVIRRGRFVGGGCVCVGARRAARGGFIVPGRCTVRGNAVGCGGVSAGTVRRGGSRSAEKYRGADTG